MPRIEGQIIISRPPDVVFDYVADQSNEPQYNPQMVRAEKITAGPVRKGTQFRSAVASRGRTAEMLIECTGYDRPVLFATATTMTQADIGYTLRFDPVASGTRMRWSGQVRPKGALRLLGPVVSWLGTRQEQRIWANLKHHLESAPKARHEGSARNLAGWSPDNGTNSERAGTSAWAVSGPEAKGLQKTAEAAVLVTGVKGPLEEGWQDKVAAFADQVTASLRARTA